MTKRHRILVVIDPTTDEQPALARAAEFGGHLDADLELFCCIFDPDIAHAEWATGDHLDHLRDSELDEQFRKLEKLAAPLRDAGRNVAVKVAWDRPLHEAIVREALDSGPDFVVKDTHHHSALSRALLTNTDWHLIRECPVPLWLVKPIPAQSGATVVAAIDPTHEHDQTAELDRRILQTAQLISVMNGERLHLLHIFEPPPPMLTDIYPGMAPETEIDIQDVADKARAIHRKALDTLAAAGGFPADQVHIRDGDQVELLPEVASELKANVVVLGAVARSFMERIIIGHTAEKTLEHFDCDVVVVKPEGFESPVAALPPIYGYSTKTSE